MKSIRLVFGAISRGLGFITRPFIGDLSWRPPLWLTWLGSFIAAHPIAMVVLVLVVGLGFFGKKKYQEHLASLPKPVVVKWVMPAYQQYLTGTNPLSIYFQKAVGKLELIGKPLSSGVTLTPPLEGTWMWSNGQLLMFQPKGRWPAATQFTVSVDPKLISANYPLDHYSDMFTTAPFTVSIADQKFYVNPGDPTERRVTATLNFSNPVVHATLENNLQFIVQNLKAGDDVSTHPLKFTVTYNPENHDQVAYVRSEPLEPAEKSGYATITVPTTVTTQDGDTQLNSEQSANVEVPSSENLFRIESAKMAIVDREDNGEPEQILAISTSVGVQTEKLASAVHVYLLPLKKKPTDDGNYAWRGASEVNDSVRGRLEPVAVKAIPSENEFNTVHTYHISVPENRYILVEIEKGTVGIGDFHLATSFGQVSAVPTYPRMVSISHDGSLLALNGERKLTISSRGVNEIEYRLARVTPGQINHLVSQTEGTFQNPTFVSSNFDETNLAEEITRKQQIALKNNSETNYSALDFSEFVDARDENKGKLGLFFLHALGRNSGEGAGYYKSDGTLETDDEVAQKNKDNPEIVYPVTDGSLIEDDRFILITDMGLVIKDNADHTHDVFVQSIKTGQPVASAHISVLGKNGIPVAAADTDDTGHAVITSLEDFVREQRPVAYVVTKGQDVSFLPFGREDREMNFSRFDVGGVNTQAPDDLSAFLFTDRGIYRPGDTAHIAIVLKQHDWKGNLDSMGVQIDITDPKETTVLTRIVKVNKNGFAEMDFPTKETMPTGDYLVNCSLVKNDNDKTQLGSTSLKVKEFLPDRLKLQVGLSKTAKGWVTLTDLKETVKLENLYGAVADGNRVTAKLSLSPQDISFDELDGYEFRDPYAEDNYTEKDKMEIDLPETVTDANGEASFDLNLPGIRTHATQLSLLVEAFEKEGGRSVRGFSGTLVSSRSWLLGVKADGDFGYLKNDSVHQAKLLAVDQNLKSVEQKGLKLKVIEHRWVSVLAQADNGNFEYKSVEKDIPQGEQTIDVPVEGVNWTVPTKTPGTFEADVFDDKGDKVAIVNYTVVGEANLSQIRDKNAELTAKLSKQEYKPGEDVEVSITAPYTGSGLLTIERDKVYAYTWFTATTTSSVQKIKVPADMEGNGYLNVTFVRGLDSKEIYMSPLSYSVLPFSINKEARRTDITIDAPKVSEPGRPLIWSVKASRPTQAVVYAVDEGILQVAGYTLPDPLAYFFQKETLGVSTRQTVDQILPEYSISRMVAAAGGGDGEDLLAHHLNPFKRKHDAPIVYWSGIIDIGPEAKSFRYNVPDYFAGTIRLMVVADSTEAVGATQLKMQVRGPFVILPNMPTVVAPGDDFDASVTVANNVPGSGADAPVELTAETTDGLTIKQAPEKTTISEGHDATVHWLLHANKALGNADFTVYAKFNDKSSHLISHVSVRPAVGYLTTVKSGYVEKGWFTTGNSEVKVDRKLYPQFQENYAQASLLPMGLSRGLATYLEHYEWGCTEQMISKAFPSLVSNDSLELGQNHHEVQDSVDSVCAVAASRQNEAGAIGLWSTQTADNPLYTCYVVHFLTEAKDRGYEVNEDLVNRALDYLEKTQEADPKDFYDARTQCYSIYLLTRNGHVTTNYIEHTRDWIEKKYKKEPSAVEREFYWYDDLSSAYLASSYQILKNQAEADKLINKFHFNGPDAEYDYDLYNHLGRDGLYLDLIAHHFPEKLKELKSEDLDRMVKPIMDGEYNTLSAAEAILGLDSYARAVGVKNSVADMTISEKKGGQVTPLKAEGVLLARSKFDSDAESIQFSKGKQNSTGLPGFYYQISQAGFDDQVVTQPLSEGIEVSKDFDAPKGADGVYHVKLGSDVKVTLRVRPVGRDAVTNAIVEDLLPGGFEVSEDMHSGDCNYYGLDYADVREDRVNYFGTVEMETAVTYTVKATTKGTFVVPPVQAESMYNPKIKARTVSGTIVVE